ncbi:thioesterase family protein [Paraglaciecola sp. 2405UD69-4]|uniref:thioesterase family protein n=1 Tax=Paraglaciecola sp. 2405UD69-4 TaxID=3391836 RepID=UPI0039C94430
MHIDNLFESIQHQLKQNTNEITLTLDNAWTQGRTIYGGISAALIYKAIRESVSSDSQMRSFNTAFIGPIEANKAISIKVEILREGKNVTQVMGHITQNGKIAVMSQASFGVNRQSKILVHNKLPHELNGPIKSNFLPAIPKVTPKFIGQFELAKSDGGWPFTGSKKSHTYGWMRYKVPPKAFTEAHLVGLIDVWPPTVLQQLRWPAAASTVNWNLEFIHPQQEVSPLDWFVYKAKTRHAQDGYANTEAEVWDSNGDLVALSRQTVAVFA